MCEHRADEDGAQRASLGRFAGEATTVRIDKRGAAILILTLGLSAAAAGPPVGAAGPRPTAPAPRGGAGINARSVVRGLAFPAAFTFAPDGRIFYGERFSGQIRIYDRGSDTDRLFYDIDRLLTDGERGLLGVVLHPNYPATAWVYAYVTRRIDGKPHNQILRFTDIGGDGRNRTTIFTGPVHNATNHQGGRILFGPDGYLYVVIGDGADPRNSQDKGKVLGKVLRLTDTGAKAPNNPFRSKVWAFGIRNSYGFGFDPRSGDLWESENGPECNDEVNRIVRGGNYAWGPRETCSTPPQPPRNTNQDGRDRHLPERWYTPTIAPTGLVFCDGCGLGRKSRGRLFFGSWKTGEIRRLSLTSTRRGVRGQSVVYDHPSGVLGMEAAPSGTIYFSDSSAIYKLT